MLKIIQMILIVNLLFCYQINLDINDVNLTLN